MDWTIPLSDVIRLTKPTTKEQELLFQQGRRLAFEKAEEVYKDRSRSYNVDRVAAEEMVWGAVSLASELHKRVTRMTSILSPLRAEYPLKAIDILRLRDTAVDTINYSSWQYSLLSMIEIPEKFDGY